MNSLSTKIGSVLVAYLFIICSIAGQSYKPYTIGALAKGDIDEVTSTVKESLIKHQFYILGTYTPVEDQGRRVIIYSSDDIQKAVSKVGGLTGFALAWRVGITKENGEVTISYTTPEYWGNAYFRENYPNVKALYDAYGDKIRTALAKCGKPDGKMFGSEDGHNIEKLRNYRYMATMPKFHKTKVLNEFSSYEEAVATIDANLAQGVEDLEKVYSIELKDKKLKLYGIGLHGENGETKFMPKIDISHPRHTAFLPYEFLVMGNQVHMLHGRYRIALSFPDLKMGQFMKIVSTPPDIKNMMQTATQ